MSRGNDSPKPALGGYFSTPEGLVPSPKGNIFSVFGEYSISAPKSSAEPKATFFDEDPSPVSDKPITSDPDYISALTGEHCKSFTCGKDSA